MNLIKSLRVGGGQERTRAAKETDKESGGAVAVRRRGKFHFKLRRSSASFSPSPSSCSSSSSPRPPSSSSSPFPQWPESSSLRSKSPLPKMTRADAHRMSLLQTEEEGDLFQQEQQQRQQQQQQQQENPIASPVSGRLSTGIRSDAGGGSGDDNDDDEEEDTSQALSLQIPLPTRESASGSSGDPSPSTEARMRTKKKQRDVVRAEEACPACGIAFGPGRRRKLIEATCGHARCYECTFRSEDCQVCERLGGGGGLPPFKGPVYEEIDQGGRGGRQPCPRPPRPHSVAGNHESSPFSLRGGRESGFQSYSSVTSSVASLNFREDDDVQDLDDRLSQCSSTLSVGGASSVASAFSNLPPIRRDLKRRSLGMMRSDVARRFEARGACGSTGGSGAGAAGLLSRNAFARRSSHFPSTRAFGGMAAIREQNYNLEADGRSLSGMSTSTQLGASHLSNVDLAGSYYYNGGVGGDVFVGRRWLLREMVQHLDSDLPTNGGFIVSGASGTGKTAFLKQLVKGGHHPLSSSGLGVVASHFCRADDEPTCLAANLVRSLASQLYSSPLLPAYREAVDSGGGARRRRLFEVDSANSYTSPGELLRQGIIQPLKDVKEAPNGYFLILVDGLCEAELHRSDGGETVASFLERHFREFPPWLRLVCTVRTGMLDIVKGFPYQRMSLDDNGFDERLTKDIKDYVVLRIRHSPALVQNTTPTAWRQDCSPQAALAEHLASSACRGSFLSARVSLDLLEQGHVVVKSSGFTSLPQTLSEAFTLRMNLLFPSQQSYGRVRALFSVCLASLRPPTLRRAYLCLQAAGDACDWEDFLHTYSVVSQFLPIGDDGETVSFFHSSFREWLTGRRSCESNKFACDERTGHAAIALYLSRRNSRLAALCPEETLDLAHHVLKAQIFRQGAANRYSPKEMQALWIAQSSPDVSAALSCPKNVLQPNLVVSKLLLLAGASPDAATDDATSDADGNDAPLLSRFVSAGNLSMVSLLVHFDADVTRSDSRGVSPLMLAAAADRAEIAAELLRGCGGGKAVSATHHTLCQSCNEGSTALSFAARAGALETLRLLLEHPCPSSEYNRQVAVREATVAACRAGKVPAIKMLLSDKDCSANSPCLLSKTLPLQAAVRAGHADAVGALLEAGADPAAVPDSPLHAAAESGCLLVVDRLLKAGCDPAARNSRGRPPMAVAAREDQIDVMELLLTKGARLDEKDADGVTPLSWSCIKSRPRSVGFLLRRGADATSGDDQSRTPLHHAAFAGCGAAVALLLERADANVEAADASGLRPIDQAVGSGRKEVVAAFLNKGAKLGPTTWAMARGKPAILLLLLNKLLEDGNALFRRNKLAEAAYRYEYAIKKLPPLDRGDGKEGEVAKSAPDGRLDEIFLKLRSHLLLNLSRAQRRLGNFAAAGERATQALELARSQQGRIRGGSSGAPTTAKTASEALWARARAIFESAQAGEEEGVRQRQERLASALGDLREAVRLAPQNLQLHRFTGMVKEKAAATERQGRKEEERQKPAKDDAVACEEEEKKEVEEKAGDKDDSAPNTGGVRTDERPEADGCDARAEVPDGKKANLDDQGVSGGKGAPLMVQECC